MKSVMNFLFQNGNVGVNIFFVLSGFLITFLLIKEKELKGTISLSNFYMRRILRIWPLFYLCVFLGFVVFAYMKYRTVPSPFEPSNAWYYIFLAANFDLIHIWPAVPDALSLIVLWSVGVEEQFYITWPMILKYSSRKIYVMIFCAIILFTLIFRSFYTGPTEAEYAMRYFHTFSVIGDMALGGMFAYYCSYDSKLFRFITNMPRWQIVSLYVLTITLVLFKKALFHAAVPLVFERLALAICFALIITEQNYAKHSFFKFSSFRSISKLGIYTYGLYCLHFIGILAITMTIEKFGWVVNNIGTTIIASIAALAVTITISLLSYHLFEKYFLRLKDKFAFITKR